MATKSFLKPDQTLEALNIVRAEEFNAGGTSEAGSRASLFCSDVLLKMFETMPSWREAKPVKLGSWARNELCAKSDIDLLFIGPESAVKEFVGLAQKQGIKIRARVPADHSDWTVGVEAFDIMALFTAQAVYPNYSGEVARQVEKLRDRPTSFHKELFRALSKERREREERYSSISNFLEPNLKYGHGGLRDLEQAFMVRDLFPEKFKGAQKAFESLAKAKGHLLTIRHYVHLSGGGDVLTSPLQFAWVKDKGIESAIQYMGFLSRLLSDVSFTSDWVEEKVTRPKSKTKTKKEFSESSTLNLSQALQLLTNEPTVHHQWIVRQADIEMPEDRKKTGLLWSRVFEPKMTEKSARALIRSHLLDKVIPDYKKVRGLVQHDQYHRYSCDAHTWQAMRLVLKAYKKPQFLGPLASSAKKLSEKDWEVLLWTALFHDLGKGRSGDHSTLGEKIALRELTELGVRLRTTIEVGWMVKNHLIMSSAAFRLNPQAPTTWAELIRRGVRGERVDRLALFTALDIYATNPDAWTDWKADLLHQLVQSLKSKPAEQLEVLLQTAEKKGMRLHKESLAALDLRLIAAIPTVKLLADLHACSKTKKDLPPLVLRGHKKSLWVRMHSRSDRAGLFMEFAQVLAMAGVSVQEALAVTDKELGVYDWFRVKSSRTPEQLTRLLHTVQNAKSGQKDMPLVRFSVIDIVAQTDNEVVLSFRGKDQKGALLAAAKALFDAGFEINSAKVHTWGQQIDDVFAVRKTPLINQGLAVVRKTLLENSSVKNFET